jgi:DNA-binding FadR family transcriptional regulator
VPRNLNSNNKRPRFRAAKQNRIFQDIVEQIQKAILTEDYQPGDMLPSERDLTEMFQTSRGTLREALRVLEQKGLIEIRLGVAGGAMVKASMVEPLAESLGLMLRYQKISLDHLNEFRADMEGMVVAKAAERAGKEDVKTLKVLLDQAWKLVEIGMEKWGEFLSVDKKFHQALANITGNSLYIFLLNIIHENIQSYYDNFLPPDDKIMRENYQDLYNILEAVKQKQVVKAQKLAQEHVNRFSEYMIDHSHLDN